jgi:hypothetical protein
MTTPAQGVFTGQLPYVPPVLMVANVELYQATWAGRLPNVQPGQLFWASGRDAVNLRNNGYAADAPPGSYLLPEPPYTAYGSPGVGAGVSNCSH